MGPARRVRAAGASVEVRRFALDRLEPVVACVEGGGRRAGGLPLFDAPTTDAQGIEGSLGSLGSDAPIGLTVLGPDGAFTDFVLRPAADGRR